MTDAHERSWTLGTRVRKRRGSSWQGRIVGFYSTELTPVGYCVESDSGARIGPNLSGTGSREDRRRVQRRNREEMRYPNEDSEWRSADSAPWGKVVWVRDGLEERPVMATRGAVTPRPPRAVVEDRGLFTTVWTPYPGDEEDVRRGHVVRPTEWTDVEKKDEES